jgi:hypothetical protein
MPSLATTYTLLFATTTLRNLILAAQTASDNFKSIGSAELAKVI